MGCSICKVQDCVFNISLSTPALTRFVSITTDTIFRHVVNADGCMSFAISQTDLEDFSTSLSSQMLHFSLQPTFFIEPDELHKISSPAIYVKELPRHVAVQSHKNVDGKKVYNLYYGHCLVKATTSLVSATTDQRWKSSDHKWYIVSTV